MVTVQRLTPDMVESTNDFHNRIYKKNRTVSQFQWEFFQSPVGASVYIIAVDGKKVVGTFAAIPFLFRDAHSREIKTAKAEDLLIDPAYRGQNIFFLMYNLMEQLCAEEGVQYIWAFSYAIKPFQRHGFSVPFKTNMGFIPISWSKTCRHFDQLTSNPSLVKKLAIRLLCSIAFMKAKLKPTIDLHLPAKAVEIKEETISLNEWMNATVPTNGIYLDQSDSFIHWRTTHNPYPVTFRNYTLLQDGKRMAHAVLSCDNQKIGHLVQIVFYPHVHRAARLFFLQHLIQKATRDCIVLRFWGFEQNEYSIEEIKLMKSSGFTFTKRGIPFVWKPLVVAGEARPVLPTDLILSRFASQGIN